MLFLVLLFLIGSIGIASADGGGNSGSTIGDLDRNLRTANNMLENRRYSSQDDQNRIHALLKNVGEFQKDEFYEKYKVNGWWGLLNIYGVGSLIQGDPTTSIITISGELGGMTLALANLRLDGEKVRFRKSYLFYIGYGVALVSVAFGQVRPWYYADKQNKKLREALYADE